MYYKVIEPCENSKYGFKDVRTYSIIKGLVTFLSYHLCSKIENLNDEKEIECVVTNEIGNENVNYFIKCNDFELKNVQYDDKCFSKEFVLFERKTHNGLMSSWFEDNKISNVLVVDSNVWKKYTSIIDKEIQEKLDIKNTIRESMFTGLLQMLNNNSETNIKNSHNYNVVESEIVPVIQRMKEFLEVSESSEDSEEWTMEDE